MALVDFLSNLATQGGLLALDTDAADPEVTASAVTDAGPALGQPAPAGNVLTLEEPGPDNTSQLGDGLQLRQSDNWTLFAGAPRESEPIQGFLGNCPLVAVLTAMAHVPHYRTALSAFVIARRVAQPYSSFRQRQAREYPVPAPSTLPRLPSKHGHFSGPTIAGVNFFSHPVETTGAGKGRVITLAGGGTVTEFVTPVLYVQVNINEVFYAHSSRSGLWVALIEKAYINRHDSKAVPDYQSLEGSVTPLRAMHELCGWAREGLLSTAEADMEGDGGPPTVLPNRTLRLWLGQHGQRPTVLGSLVQPASADIVGNHTFAVTGFDAKAGIVTLQNALEEEASPDRVVTIPFGALRANFGEIVQGPFNYGVQPDP